MRFRHQEALQFGDQLYRAGRFIASPANRANPIGGMAAVRVAAGLLL